MTYGVVVLVMNGVILGFSSFTRVINFIRFYLF